MTEATTSQPSVTQPNPGLLTRLIGVLFSPRETFAAIVARPKWLGAVTVVGLIMGGATFAQLSTDIGKELALDQQVSAIEAFGVTISDEQYRSVREWRSRIGDAGSRIVREVDAALVAQGVKRPDLLCAVQAPGF